MIKRRGFLKTLLLASFTPSILSQIEISGAIVPLPHYISPEALKDIQVWNVNYIDKKTRKEILNNGWT